MGYGKPVPPERCGKVVELYLARQALKAAIGSQCIKLGLPGPQSLNGMWRTIDDLRRHLGE
jgi:hypothetical protein